MRTVVTNAIIIFVLLHSFSAFAQREGYVWIFGNNAGLDFNSGTPVPVQSNITTIEGSASICNASGQLLFYTEGSTIWDRNGNPMPNGTNLTGLILSGYSPTASTTQSSLIIPMIDSPGKYYVFSLTDGTIQSIHKLFYSIVDMSLNGGLGDVVPGRKGIQLDSVLSEKLTATLGKCSNIWVVVNNTTGNFHAFEITAAGLNTMPVISPSGINNGFSYNYGEIKFSPDGNMMAAGSQSYFGLKLYDFDGYTGMFSNIRSIKNKDFYGVCFSPDNKKLYAASDSLYQYDLTVPTHNSIVNSQQILVRTGGLTNVKRGPDNKLYFQGQAGISVVDFPDMAGTACHIRDNAILPLPGTFVVYGGLSNDVVVLRHDTAAFTRRDTSVCFRDSIQLSVPSPGCHYVWEDGSTNIPRTVTHDGKYAIQYITPPSVFHSDTIAVHFAAAIPVTGVYNGCGAAGSAFLYILPGAGDHFPYTYTWFDSVGNQLQQHTSATGDTVFVVNPGHYSVYMSGNGCDTTINLTLLPPQSVLVSFNTDTVICIGDSSRFTNTSAGFNNYLWLFGDGDSSVLVNPVHYYSQPGTYQVTLIGYPCGDTLIKTVVVDSMSYITFTTNKIDYCAGEGVLFTPNTHGGVAQLLWDFDDGSAILSALLPMHAYDAAGQYNIKVTAQFRACPDTSFTGTINVYDYPVVDLGTDTFMCNTDNPIALTSLIATVNDYKYRWNTGDTTTSIIVNHPGIYELTVTNDHNCATTDSIDIKQSCYIDIPNAFSPNSDGINDYFFPRNMLSHALSMFHMQIFDRWGQQIFETNNTDGRGWDGRYGNRPLPEGVYIYLIEAAFTNGVTEKYHGNVTLIR